jgi:hypothetical protein
MSYPLTEDALRPEEVEISIIPKFLEFAQSPLWSNGKDYLKIFLSDEPPF